MTKDKQIEEIAEMAKIAYGIEVFDKSDAKIAVDEGLLDSLLNLYNAGYRKASDVALEVIKKVEHELTVKIIGIEEDFFHGTAAHWDAARRDCYEELLVELAELKKKYTEEVK